MQVGDVITKIAGVRVKSVEVLSFLEQTVTGPVNCEIIRGKGRMTVTVGFLTQQKQAAGKNNVLVISSSGPLNGYTVAEVSPDSLSFLNRQGQAVVVITEKPASTLDFAGDIGVGDVILELNGYQITGISSLKQAIASSSTGNFSYKILKKDGGGVVSASYFSA